jgi:hypothetical protein
MDFSDRSDVQSLDKFKLTRPARHFYNITLNSPTLQRFPESRATVLLLLLQDTSFATYILHWRAMSLVLDTIEEGCQ